MTTALDSREIRSAAPFDPERWRRTYAAGRGGHLVHRSEPVAPESVNLTTLLVAALLTALIVVGLVSVAEFASGGGAPNGLHAAAAVVAGESAR